MTRAAIIGTGMYVPPKVVSNDDLAGRIDTSDEWITERSGIKERRWLETDADGWTVQSGAEMGAEAARQAIEAAGIEPDAIDQIIYATLNPDCFFPGNGVFIEDLLGLNLDVRDLATDLAVGLVDHHFGGGQGEAFLL